jgi:hypothetical protein
MDQKLFCGWESMKTDFRSFLGEVSASYLASMRGKRAEIA